MSSSTTLKAVLIGEDRSLSRTMKGASKSVEGVGDDMDRTGKKSGLLAGSMGKMGGAIAAGAVVAGVAVVGFAFQSVQAASDLNQTLSKSKVIFGDSAAEIETWGSTAYKNLGLSKNQAIGAAASFGDMFLQLGFAKDTATGMSTSVVQLAADLGAFNNLPTAEVADMISSAFRGEYDSLQRLIPNINAARVETEALAMTGKKSAKELTAQEKAAATLAIVQRDGAKAAGAFAAESDSLAGSQEILKAAFEDTKAEVGTALLPIMTDLGRWLVDEGIPAVKDMTKWWNDHKSQIQSAARIVGQVLMVMGKAVEIATKANAVGWKAVGTAAAGAANITYRVVAAILGGLASLMRTWASMLRALSKVPGFGWAATAADKMEGAARKADGLKAAIGRIPTSRSTNFAANTGTAIGSVRALETKIAGVRGKSVTISVHYAYSQSGSVYRSQVPAAARKASGGPVWPKMPTLVGENGPELVTFGSTAHVTPARQTAEMLSGSRRSGGGSSDDGRPIVVQLMAPNGRMMQEVLVQHKRATGQNLGLA